MSDPVTYNFNLTTVPVLRNITISTINVLRTAKDEQSKSSLPADEQILDSTFGDILPFRVQPMLLANFSVAALEFLKLPKAGVPALRADFKTLDEMIIEFCSIITKTIGLLPNYVLRARFFPTHI
jgi:hypothetical protein